MYKLPQMGCYVNLQINNVGIKSNIMSLFPNNSKQAPKANKKRGQIKGFSTKSSQRLRELLFRIDWVNYQTFGITLTVPQWSNANATEEFAKISKTYTREYSNPLIWRKEVQSNGKEHYHCIMIGNDIVSLFKESVELIRQWRNIVCKHIDKSKFKELHPDKKPTQKQARAFKDYADSKGALKFIECTSEALGYLCDHTSKHKEYQAQTEGRAWGVIHRKKLPLSIPDDVDISGLTPRQVANVLKYSRRMSKKKIPSSKSLFGYKLSNGRMVANKGQHVIISQSIAQSVRRLIDHYLDEQVPF